MQSDPRYSQLLNIRAKQQQGGYGGGPPGMGGPPNPAGPQGDGNNPGEGQQMPGMEQGQHPPGSTITPPMTYTYFPQSTVSECIKL